MKTSKIGGEDLDKLAYHLVCNWWKEVSFDPIYDGIDYSLIVRFYLWDKIGRSIRIKYGIDTNEENRNTHEKESSIFYYNPIQSKGKYRKKWFSKRRTLFVPFVLPEKLLDGLEYKSDLEIITKGLPSNKKLSRQINVNFNIDGNSWTDFLLEAIVQSLKRHELVFIKKDLELLKKQIKGTFHITQLAEKELVKYKPSGVFVHSDNHPPFINYVLVAQKHSIPTFSYQHGLDCEHYYLDDCFVDYMAVWSLDRKERYQRDSKYQPKQIEVTGNYKLLEPVEIAPKSAKKKLLYVSRPHSTFKCYSPSRTYNEGLDILDGILDYIQLEPESILVIKPHPFDYVDEYDRLIQKRNLGSRVSISNAQLSKLFLDTNLVITEDSTAGAEALLYKLPLVHAHFANSKPVLPFDQYGCGLLAINRSEIVKNINFLVSLNEDEKTALEIKQKKFIKDYIPKGEVNNLVNFIKRNL